MLQLLIPKTELFDESTQTFIMVNETVLKLEHSLLSISKWESKWCKRFLLNKGEEPHSSAEILDYIRCMTINSVSKNVYNALTSEHIQKISDYINSPMTATTIHNRKTSNHRESVTSELIYYWMVAYNIPFSCEKWHINRLLMLIQVCEAKNDTKKMSNREIAEQNRSINAARRKMLKTKG